MNTVDDLRRSLEETAHAHQAPDPHELLRNVQDDIATGRGMPSRRPRIVAAAAAVALVAAGGWALTQGLGEENSHTVQPADETWELVDGAPPEYAAGLALVDTVKVGAGEDGAVILDPEPLTGPSYALAWCTEGPRETEPFVVGVGPADAEDNGVPVGCLDQGAAAGVTPVPLPDLSGDIAVHRLPAEAAEETGEPDPAQAVIVGLYREAPPVEFPYPDQQEIPEPPDHDVVLDSASPSTLNLATPVAPLEERSSGGGPAGPLDVRGLRGVSVATHEGTTLSTWAGEPGRLLVAVNGTVITNDGEGLSQPTTPGPWQDADPDLRGGYWHTWAAGESTREFDLSPAGLAAHGIQVTEGDQVTVVASGAFPRDAWQVGIDQPEGAGERADLTSVEPNEVLPEFAYGFEQVTAVSVPADGAAHDVEVGDVDPTELVWVAQCPEGMQLTQVQVGGSTTQCQAGLEWLLAVQDAGLVAGQPVQVTVAPGAEPVTVAAYAPRVWEDYPFGESTDPMGASEEVALVQGEPAPGQAPPEMAETSGTTAVYREVATVGTDDLDADGRAEITVPSSTDLSIWLETTGVARAKLQIDGTPIEQLLPTPEQPAMQGTLLADQLLVRDGWYSTWTGEPSGYELRFDAANSRTGQAERDNPTVTVQVEAQDGAEVELTFYEFVPEAELDD